MTQDICLTIFFSQRSRASTHLPSDKAAVLTGRAEALPLVRAQAPHWEALSMSKSRSHQRGPVFKVSESTDTTKKWGGSFFHPTGTWPIHVHHCFMLSAIEMPTSCIS